MTKGQLGFFGAKPLTEEDEAKAERRHIRLHGKPWDHGILWDGERLARGKYGAEVYRLDHIDDEDSQEPIYDDDLEAAHVVAENGFPWLLFEDYGPKADPPRWSVRAFAQQKYADRALQVDLQMAAEDRRPYTGVVFNGRTETLVVQPDGATYLGTAVPRF